MIEGYSTRASSERHSAVQLLQRARRQVAAAAESGHPREQFLQAHLGALRAASAMVSLRSSPVASMRSRSGAGRRPRDVWSQLAECAPELCGWAEFFAEQATRRARVEAGLGAAPQADESYRLLLQAEVFVDAVAVLMGLPVSAEREYPTLRAG